MLAKRLQLETVRRMSAVTTSSHDPLEADGPPEPAGRPSMRLLLGLRTAWDAVDDRPEISISSLQK
jgi:hypothetical protein